jgi:pyruvate dehydrogenase E2 component (dihydrolipoamide acetyltransferase)
MAEPALARPERDRVPLSPMRRITLRALERARDAAVPVTVLAEADAAALERERGGTSVTAVLAHHLAQALAAHPDLNAAIDGDDLVRFADVHLGIAVALPDGNLTVPVVPRAQALDLGALAEAIADRTARARAGRLGLEDVRGGTFTLSNVGRVFPAAQGTPLIPAGHAGILLTGGIVDRPVVRDGAVVAGRVLPLSFTFDHRVVNGEPALRFLRTFVDAVEAG